MEYCPLLVFKIDLGNGQIEEVIVNEEDEPSDLAESFCRRHNLDSGVQQALQKQLEIEIDKLIEQEVEPLISVDSTCSVIPEEPSLLKEDCSVLREESMNILIKDEQISQYLLEDSCISKSSIFNEAPRLYYQGMRQLEYKKKVNEYKRLTDAQEIMKEASFKPKINESSAPRNVPPEIGLLQKWKERNEKLEEIRQKEIESEKLKYTFQPDISKTRLDNTRNTKKYLSLYENAKIRKLKITQFSNAFIKKQCPFAPDTSLTSQTNKTLTKGRNRKIKNKSVDNVPKENEELSFKPKIGRPPLKRDCSPRSIGQHLYSFSQKTPSQDEQQQSVKLAIEKSEHIVRSMKDRRYQELFDALGPYNGYIYTGGNWNLDKETLHILRPLLDELADFDEKLDFEEFCSSMDALLKTLTPIERNYLLLKKNKTGEIAQKRTRRASTGDAMYIRNLKFKEDSEKKIEMNRNAKIADEEKECTFKPRINTYKLKKQDNSWFLF